MVPLFFSFFIALMLGCGALLAPFLGLPLSFRLLGLVLVTADGAPISRLRSAGRSIPILLLALGCGVASAGLLFDLHTPPFLIGVFAATSIFLLLGAISCIMRPERGLLDSLAGTFLVAR
jgi:hypothetical protein